MDPEERARLKIDSKRRITEMRDLASRTQALIADSRRIQEKFEETDAELLSDLKKLKSRTPADPQSDLGSPPPSQQLKALKAHFN
jgi:hypothetical protein